ncbi:MAG: hypothetical protein R2681_01935 [Pyrinomonadaceae bacterium]
MRDIISEFMKDIPQLKLDKSRIKIGSKIEDSLADEVEYWQNTTVKERLQHIERLRRINYGTRATGRLQRVIQIVKCK